MINLSTERVRFSMARLTRKQAMQKADDLEEILEAMKAHLADIRKILRGTGMVEQRAKAYWFASISMALDSHHEYLGSDGETMQGAINELRGIDGDEDESGMEFEIDGEDD
jgi:hypothetical protein